MQQPNFHLVEDAVGALGFELSVLCFLQPFPSKIFRSNIAWVASNVASDFFVATNISAPERSIPSTMLWNTMAFHLVGHEDLQKDDSIAKVAAAALHLLARSGA